MKKLVQKDKITRYYYLNRYEKKHIIFKLIFKNFNFFILLRWLSTFLAFLTKNNSKTVMLNRCLLTYNKKRFNKLSVFSRHIFLKLIKKGLVLGTFKK